MSTYMRICYVLTTISKTYVLYTQGPREVSILPGQVHAPPPTTPLSQRVPPPRTSSSAMTCRTSLPLNTHARVAVASPARSPQVGSDDGARAQGVIDGIGVMMFIVEPGHFIALCWITHHAFPLKATNQTNK